MANSNQTEVTRYPPVGSLVSPTVRSVVRLLVYCVRATRLHCLGSTTNHFQVTGYGVERFGYRPFILTILFYQSAITTIFFCAPSVKILLVAECLAGIAFGVFMSGKHAVSCQFGEQQI